MADRFSFDPDLCIKCWACTVACKQWHDVPAGQGGYREVRETCTGTFPKVKRRFESVALRGCDLCRSCGGRPRCALACPTEALRFE